MGLPTRGEKIAELNEHLRKAAEAAYVLGHLEVMGTSGRKDELMKSGWHGIGELLERMVAQVAKLGAGRLQ